MSKNDQQLIREIVREELSSILIQFSDIQNRLIRIEDGMSYDKSMGDKFVLENMDRSMENRKRVIRIENEIRV